LGKIYLEDVKGENGRMYAMFSGFWYRRLLKLLQGSRLLEAVLLVVLLY
jgi:hypothetical protein